MNADSTPRSPDADDRAPQPGTPINRDDLANALVDRNARQRLAVWLDTEMTNDTLLRRENWPLAATAAGVTATVVLAVWLIAAFVTGLTSAVTAGGRNTATVLQSDSVLRTASGSITAWLDTHTAGLPATSADLAMAWLVIAVVLYLAAIVGSTYARIAWTLTGAAAIAAAYTGAATTTAPTTAATTAAIWLLLSLPVYRHRTRRSVPADAAS